MKKALTLSLLLLLMSLSNAQDKIPFIDIDEIQELVAESSEKEDYVKTLEYLNKINKNDSSYCSILTSKSYYLLNSEKYQEVISVTNEGLDMGCHNTKRSFYINKGLAYNYLEDYEKALETFNKGLEIFPKNYLLWYNKGIVLENLKRIEDAVKAYQMSIVLRPTYINPHLQLGNICYEQKKMAQALMCYDIYLLLKFNQNSAYNTLRSLNNLVEEKNESTPNSNLVISEDDEAFEDIDLILENKIALNKKYETGNKINISLTKQNHALLEQLKDFEGNGGFWDQKYVPLFKWITENNLFDPFTYTLSHSIQNEKYSKIIQQKEKEITSFRKAFYGKWYTIIGENAPSFKDKSKKASFTYNDYNAQGLGVIKNNTNIGYWQFFRESGQLMSEGSHDDAGDRIGKWTWYHTNSNVDEIANYKNGKIHGEYTSFYENGKPKAIGTYNNGKLDGEYKYYNNKGALIQKKYFKNGALDGLYTSYFDVGETLVEWEIPYSNDTIISIAKEYYSNSDLYNEIPFKNGKRHGIDKKYHFNKKLASEVSYVNGELNGVYKSYYNNGNVYEEGISNENFYNGPWKIFHKDGTLKIAQNYANGNLNDLSKEYDTDGKLISEFTYRKGEVIAYKFYDKKGDILKEAKKKGGEFLFTGYSANGIIYSKGLYNIKGGKEGNWEFYSSNGVLTGKGSYTENKANGEHISYYNNSEIESITQYKNDTVTGYYSLFYKNGQLKRQGWYKNDNAHGEWRSYYIDGTLEEINFYHKGKLHGFQESFSPKGKLAIKYFYKYGDLLSETYFNHSGKEITKLNLIPNKKDYTITKLYSNGNPNAVLTYKNGLKHGEYKGYDFYGNIAVEGKYNNNEFDGKWTWYYENGNLETEIHYRDGKKNGETTYYHENGLVSEKKFYEFGNSEGKWLSFNKDGKTKTDETNYYNNKLHGKRLFYDNLGNLQLIRFYNHGRLIGYSYFDKTAKELPMIPITKETGKIKAYYSNGNVSREMEFLNGKFINTYKEYYFDGTLESEANYIDGDNDGLMTNYYPNGNKKSVYNYQYDVLQGKVIKFYENGNKKEEISYHNDTIDGEYKYYNEKGKLIKKELYFNGDVYEAETY